MRSLVVSHAGKFRAELPHDAIDVALREPHTILWLDITDPTPEDQILLREEFGFHPLAIEDAVRAHERPKVDAYGLPWDEDGDGLPDAKEPCDATPRRMANNPPPANRSDEAVQSDEAAQIESGFFGSVEGGDELDDLVLLPLESLTPAEVDFEAEAARNGYYFMVFYAAVYNPKEDHIEAHAVSMFIGANYLVTVHTGTVSHIADTIARWRAPRSPLSHRISVLVHALLDSMVDDYFPLMDQVADRVEELEDTIFIHFDEGSIETMFRLKKDLLSMRRIVAPERDVLNVLLRRQLPIFALEDMAYLQDVYDHIVRVTDSIDTYRDLLSSALDSYLSLQSNKLNQIMKILTIASIILMTAALITGFYGQNFKYFPSMDWRIGSFWSLILIAASTLALVIYFRWKKWL
jgi:magnesium transporter